MTMSQFANTASLLCELFRAVRPSALFRDRSGSARMRLSCSAEPFPSRPFRQRIGCRAPSFAGNIDPYKLRLPDFTPAFKPGALLAVAGGYEPGGRQHICTYRLSDAADGVARVDGPCLPTLQRYRATRNQESVVPRARRSRKKSLKVAGADARLRRSGRVRAHARFL